MLQKAFIIESGCSCSVTCLKYKSETSMFSVAIVNLIP